MTEPTHDQPTTDSPPEYNQVRWCGWCRTYRTGCVLIDLQASATVPNAPTPYACEPCCQARGLAPLADREPTP